MWERPDVYMCGEGCLREKWDFIWRRKGKMAKRDEALKTEPVCHRWKGKMDFQPSQDSLGPGLFCCSNCWPKGAAGTGSLILSVT